MPEFAICFGSDNAYRTYRKADSFTQGYIEALFFTNASDQDDECHPSAKQTGGRFTEIAPPYWHRSRPFRGLVRRFGVVTC